MVDSHSTNTNFIVTIAVKICDSYTMISHSGIAFIAWF